MSGEFETEYAEAGRNGRAGGADKTGGSHGQMFKRSRLP